MANIIHGILDKEELKTFMEPSEIEYPFCFLEFVNQKNNRSEYLIEKKNRLYTNIFTKIFGADFNGLKTMALYSQPVLAYDKTEGWNISITTNSIINDILRHIDSKTRVDDYYLPIDNSLNKKEQKKQYLLDVLNKELSEQRCCTNKEIIKKAIEKIDLIMNCKYVDLDRRGDITTKSLAMFLALECLKGMEQGNNLLCDFANTYYERVSKPASSAWPSTIWFEGEPYFTYSPFNERYEKLLKKDVKAFQKPTKFNQYHILSSLSFLPSGKIDRNFMEMRTSKGTVRFNPEAILTRMHENEKRMKFYESFDRKEAFVAQGEGLDGYFGYVFPNNYIVFDKFFTNYETRYPAGSNAIYAMTADKFLYSEFDKQTMTKIAKEDPTVFKFNHYGAWKSRIKEVYEMPDISQEDFEDVVDKYQKETGKKILLRG
jgi:hypothetical protein